MKAIGKIAQLPAKTREALNRRLHDGQPASVILPWLNALPEVQDILKERFEAEPVSEQNLSLWRNGGFVRWQAESAEIESTKQLAQFSADLAEAAGLGISKAAKALAAGRIMAKLQTAGDEMDLQTLLGLTKAAKDLHAADIAEAGLNLDERKAGQKDKELDLKERQFQLRFVAAFIEHAQNEAAHRLATDSTLPAEVKTEQLRLMLFGARPTSEAGTPAR
jgi:hypothetical protein